MTTLAEVNATLGITNLALSGVAKEQKQTNEGISKFVDFMKSKDTRDRREDIETNRETKASVISRVGGAAGAVGSGAKKGFGLGKDLFSKLGGILPIGLAGTFLTSLLGSKMFRFGVAGLGVMFGDRIAEMLTGEDAKQEVKDTLGGVIKGGALGFLLGPRFALIGGILGGLLKNETVDKEAGELLINLRKLEVKFPAISTFFKGFGDAVGSGLKSINNLLEGKSENTFKDIGKSLLLVGGVAALFMPGKILALLAGASRLMMATPAGAALLAIAGGGVGINKLMGNEATDSSGFIASTAATGAALYGGKKVVDKFKGKSSVSKAPDIDPASKGLKGKDGAEGRIDKGLMKSLSKYPRLAKFLKFAGRFGGLGTLLGVGEILNMARTGNVTVDAVSGLFGGILGGVGGTKLGAALGSFFPGPGTILGGIVGGGLGYFAGDTVAKGLSQWMLGKKVDAFGFDAINNLFNDAGASSSSKSAGSVQTSDELAKASKINANSRVRNQFEANRNIGGTTASGMDPTGNAGDVNMVNSNNRTVTTNNSAGVVLDTAGAVDRQDNLSNQIKNPSNLF